MTGPEHYIAAARLLKADSVCECPRTDCEHAAVLIAAAQAHATLALAAATALPPFQGLSASDSDDWAQALERVVTS